MNFLGPAFDFGAKILGVVLVKLGLKNSPEMKDRDLAEKDQEAADRIDKSQKDKNEKTSREDWG